MYAELQSESRRNSKENIVLDDLKSPDLESANGYVAMETPLSRTQRASKMLQSAAQWSWDGIKRFARKSLHNIVKHPAAFGLAALSSLVPFAYNLVMPSKKSPVEAGADISAWWNGMTGDQQFESVQKGIASFFLNTVFGTIYNIATWAKLKEIKNFFNYKTIMGRVLIVCALIIGLTAAVGAGALSWQAFVATSSLLAGTVTAFNFIGNFATRFVGASNAAERFENWKNSPKDGADIKDTLESKNDKVLGLKLIDRLNKLKPSIKKDITKAMRTQLADLEKKREAYEDQLKESDSWKKEIEKAGRKVVKATSKFKDELQLALEEHEKTGNRSAIFAKKNYDKAEKLLLSGNYLDQVQEEGFKIVRKSEAFKEAVQAKLNNEFVATVLQQEIFRIINNYADQHPNDSIFKEETFCQTALHATLVAMTWGWAMSIAMAVSLTFGQKGREAGESFGITNEVGLKIFGAAVGLATSLFYFITSLNTPEIIERTAISIWRDPTNLIPVTVLAYINYLARDSVTVAAQKSLTKDNWVGKGIIDPGTTASEVYVAAQPVAIMTVNTGPTIKNAVIKPSEINPDFYDLILRLEGMDLDKKDIADLYALLALYDETLPSHASKAEVRASYVGLFDQNRRRPMVHVPSTSSFPGLTSPMPATPGNFGV